MNGDAIIGLENVEKIYGFGNNAFRVLKNISLSVNAGEIVSVVGPSGAGKSTLMNIIGCLDGFESGRLAVGGRDVTNHSVETLSDFRNRHIGFIFQLHNLLPEFTAVENVMMPLLIRREGRRSARKKAMELIARFGLAERASHKPSEMSGGECQRIAVARAIAGDPSIILADEPTGSLDSENSSRLTRILFDIGRDRGTTIVIVTHSPQIAQMTERTITLVDGAITSDVKNVSSAGDAGTGEEHCGKEGAE